VARFWELPAWAKGIIATITALSIMLGLTVGLGFDVAASISGLVSDHRIEHRDISHRIKSLEWEACVAYKQDDIERSRMGGMGHALKRPRPSWCKKDFGG
jgi:hypothetical protein